MEQQLHPGEPGLDVGGLRLQVAGFSGVATEHAGDGEPAGAGERGGGAMGLGDRLVAYLEATPDDAFRVGPPVEVAGEAEVVRGGAAEAADDDRHGSR